MVWAPAKEYSTVPLSVVVPNPLGKSAASPSATLNVPPELSRKDSEALPAMSKPPLSRIPPEGMVIFPLTEVVVTAPPSVAAEVLFTVRWS